MDNIMSKIYTINKVINTFNHYKRKDDDYVKTQRFDRKNNFVGY